ncbi:beta-propeller fold lactonase family protein [Naumannella sp. ID2617S]|nr:beta-propeller fold lactonase family protein [Naumannella sp. ID2617S]
MEKLLIVSQGDGPEHGIIQCEWRDDRAYPINQWHQTGIAGLSRGAGEIVHALRWTAEDQPDEVVSLRVDPDGFVELGRAPSGGGTPCAAALPEGARDVLAVANYSGASVGLVELTDAAATRLRGTWPLDAVHPHMVLPTVHGNVVPDLGADVLHLVGADGRVERIAVPAGVGPRHAVPIDLDRVAVSGELGAALAVVDLAARRVESVTPSTATEEGAYVGDLVLVDDHVLVANRGHATLGVIRLGERPELVGELEVPGRWPQHLKLIGDRVLVACRDSDVVLALDVTDPGRPTVLPEPAYRLPSPVWLHLLAA